MLPTTGNADQNTALATVRREVAAACRDAGRHADEVTLVAVSKTFDAEAIEPVISAGQRVFGENRVQEAQAKWPALRERHPGLTLHLLGPLQSNKAKMALSLCYAIDSGDRPSLCVELAKQTQRHGRAPVMFVQINTG